MLHAVKATAVVSARGVARIRAGHPWIFRDDVARGPERDAGDGGPSLVDVTDGRGRFLGRATWARGARIGLRMLGPLAIARAGAPLELPASRKTCGLLAYLALTRRPPRLLIA